MVDTARILLVVVLKNILRAFFIINFHVILSQRSLRSGLTSGWRYSHTCETARAAQKSSPLSSAGVLDAKSGVGTGSVPFKNIHGRYPPKPGNLSLYL